MSLAGSVKLSTKVSGRELLVSNVVHIGSDEQVEVFIDNLRFVFSFKNDDGNPRYEGRLESDGLFLDLYNHNNSFGEGMFSPIDVALLNERTLSVTYFTGVVNKDSGVRRFEYAFYLGDKN